MMQYRFSFIEKENDNEMKGTGNQQDDGFRIYNPRLGRFLSADPLSHEFPWHSPYQFAGNKPIRFVDLDGAEPADPLGMWLSNPGTKDYGDHYQNGGTLIRVNDGITNQKYFVFQQSMANGGVSFQWYNSDIKSWQPFTPTGYIEPNHWQNTNQNSGNFASFQAAIKSNQGRLNLAAGFATFSAGFSAGYVGSLYSSGVNVFRGVLYERLAGGLSDMSVQLLTGKSFGKDYNFTSTIANVALPYSPFVNAALGSLGEFTAESKFTLGTKSFGQTATEITFGTIGNIGVDKIGNYGASLSTSTTEKLTLKTLGGMVGNTGSTAASELQQQSNNP